MQEHRESTGILNKMKTLWSTGMH